MADNDVRIKVSLEGDKVVISGLEGIGEAADTADSKLNTFSKVGALGAQTALTGLKVAAAGTAAVITNSLVRGLGRLTNIDTARTKLEALGNSTEDVAAIMDMANRAVTDTAFGLDEAAGAAGALAAAKVPLSGIETALTSMAGVAGVAGSSMSEMGDIFAKVAAQQKLDGQVVNQLLQRQVPILQMIQDHYGITGEEAKKMVSDGSISFEEFIEITGQLGDAAVIMGESFTGQLSNVNAAMGRSGAIIEGPFFDALKNLLTPIKDVINAFNGTTTEAGEMTGVLTPLASVINDTLAPATERFAGILTSIAESKVFDIGADGASNLLASLGPLLPAIGGLAGLMGPLLSGLPMIGPLFSGLSGPVGIFAGALTMLTAIKPETLMQGFDALADSLPGILENLISMVADLLPKMLERIVANAGVLITGVLNILTSLVPVIVSAIPQLVDAFVELVPKLINALMEAVPLIVEAGIELFVALVEALPEIITMIVEVIPDIIDSVVTAVLDNIPILIEAGFSLFTALVDNLPQIIITIIKAIPQIISSIVTALVKAFPQIIQAGFELLTQIVTKVGESARYIAGKMPQIITSIGNAIGEGWSTLVEAGKNLMRGVWDGISSMGDWLWNRISGFFDGIWSNVLNFFGIQSPSKLFRDELGKQLVAGAGIGITANADLVLNPIDDLNKKIFQEVTDLPQLTLKGMVSGNLDSSVPYRSVATESVSTPSLYSTALQPIIRRDADTVARISSADMDTLATRVASALVRVRHLDSRDAQLALMQEVR